MSQLYPLLSVGTTVLQAAARFYGCTIHRRSFATCARDCTWFARFGAFARDWRDEPGGGERERSVGNTIVIDRPRWRTTLSMRRNFLRGWFLNPSQRVRARGRPRVREIIYPMPIGIYRFHLSPLLSFVSGDRISRGAYISPAEYEFKRFYDIYFGWKYPEFALYDTAGGRSKEDLRENERCTFIQFTASFVKFSMFSWRKARRAYYIWSRQHGVSKYLIIGSIYFSVSSFPIRGFYQWSRIFWDLFNRQFWYFIILCDNC